MMSMKKLNSKTKAIYHFILGTGYAVWATGLGFGFFSAPPNWLIVIFMATIALTFVGDGLTNLAKRGDE